MKIIIPLIVFSLVISFKASSQALSTDEEIYDYGRFLYSQNLYDSAMDVLHPLTDKTGSQFAPYAGYYYCLASYKKGFEYIALDMANYIMINYPKWNNLNELRLWLVKFYLADKNYSKAISIVDDINADKVKKLYPR